jgi:ABC-type antimicrobial peptide transport system permease subunit
VRVLTLVLREALVLASSGVAAGWLVAVVGGGWLQALLYDTSRTDPLVLGSAGLLMLAIAAAATLIPARSAARADPAALLR